MIPIYHIVQIKLLNILFKIMLRILLFYKIYVNLLLY